MFHYLKYFSFHIMALICAFSISLGGMWISIGFGIWLIWYILGDFLMGDDTSEPNYKYPKVLVWQLWMALPLLLLIVFAALWQFATVDVLGYGVAFQQLTGFNIIEARAATSALQHFVLIPFVGLAIGLIGTLTGHELTHKTWDSVSMLIGRWLLAFSFDSNFSIEHVYGHHRYVSTIEDPATAPRGRNVYMHVLSSTVRGNISAWNIEKERLTKKHQGLFSIHNRALRGYAMSLVLIVFAFLIAGWIGVMFFVAAGVFGKAILEVVNYMEHYGIVRNPDSPVQPRHSWNTNKKVSSWAMFNLSRHSHHHAQGEVPYYELKPYSDAPMMVAGYLTTLVIALIPPLWHKLMIPKVLEWDQKFATAEELVLANEANHNSGIPAFTKVEYKLQTS